MNIEELIKLLEVADKKDKVLMDIPNFKVVMGIDDAKGVEYRQGYVIIHNQKR